jgi:hypothetical protein
MRNATAIVQGKGNGNGKCIGKYTPERHVISREVGVRLKKEMYEADSDIDGELEWLYFLPEPPSDVRISSDAVTDTTKEADSG